VIPKRLNLALNLGGLGFLVLVGESVVQAMRSSYSRLVLT